MSEDLFKQLEEEVFIACEGAALTDTDDCGERAVLAVFIEHVPCECDQHCDTLITYVCLGHAVSIDIILSIQARPEPCQLCGEDMSTLDHLRYRQSLLAPTSKEE